jgi:hypothetical protein
LDSVAYPHTPYKKSHLHFGHPISITKNQIQKMKVQTYTVSLTGQTPLLMHQDDLDGIPTAPDVKRMVAKFGIPEIGQLIPYSETAECIGFACVTPRWRTVIQAWRKLLYREHNVYLRAECAKGFVAADPSERVHISASGYKGALRKVVRSGDLALRTDKTKLLPAEIRACDHVINAAAAIKLAAAVAARSMRLPDANTGK